MSIHEPATLLTDYLLAALGTGFAWRLRRHTSPGNDAARWWIRAMLAMALAAFVGGSYHGFAPNLSPAAAAVWWKLVLGLICFLGLSMGLSLVREILPPDRRRGWDGFLVGKFMLSVGVILVHPVFLVAILDYGPAMIAWALAALLLRRAWSGWMLCGTLLSGVAAWVQQSGWDFPGHLNHNDVYHLIQGVALVGFYRGGRKLGG